MKRVRAGDPNGCGETILAFGLHFIKGSALRRINRRAHTRWFELVDVHRIGVFWIVGIVCTHVALVATTPR